MHSLAPNYPLHMLHFIHIKRRSSLQKALYPPCSGINSSVQTNSLPPISDTNFSIVLASNIDSKSAANRSIQLHVLEPKIESKSIVNLLKSKSNGACPVMSLLWQFFLLCLSIFDRRGGELRNGDIRMAKKKQMKRGA